MAQGQTGRQVRGHQGRERGDQRQHGRGQQGRRGGGRCWTRRPGSLLTVDANHVFQDEHSLGQNLQGLPQLLHPLALGWRKPWGQGHPAPASCPSPPLPSCHHRQRNGHHRLETPRHQGWGSNSSSQTRNLKPRRAGPTARKWPSRKWPSRKWPSPGLHTALAASGLSLLLPWPPAASLCTLLSRRYPAVGRAPHTGPWVGGALLVSVPVPPIRGQSRGCRKARGRAQRWRLCVPGNRPTHGEGPRVSGHVNRLINGEDKMTRSL